MGFFTCKYTNGICVMAGSRRLFIRLCYHHVKMSLYCIASWRPCCPCMKPSSHDIVSSKASTHANTPWDSRLNVVSKSTGEGTFGHLWSGVLASCFLGSGLVGSTGTLAFFGVASYWPIYWILWSKYHCNILLKTSANMCLFYKDHRGSSNIVLVLWSPQDRIYYC